MQIYNKEPEEPRSLPFVSVIVPVYNDTEALERCLDVLDDQSYPHSCYEVIVVDNNSMKDTRAVVKKYKQTVFGLEKKAGSYAARNKGISIARGDIIAFTDSDCIPARDWIERGVSYLQNKPECGFVAGRIELLFKNPACLNAVEVYENIKGFNQKHKVEKYRHGVTANLFTHRKIIDRVGKFDAFLKSGADVKWGQRVHAFGFELIYADDVRVSHPARHSWKQLYQKITRVVGGIYDWKGNQKPYLALSLFKDLSKLLKSIVVLIFQFSFNLPFSKNFIGGRQKLRYIFAVVFVGAVRIYEKSRLQLGGKSRR